MLYKSVDMTPSNIAYDGENEDYVFKIKINGDVCCGYQIYIDRIHGTEGTLNTVFTSNKVTLNENDYLYDGQYIEITIPKGTLTNTKEYYYQWYADLYEDSEMTAFETTMIKIINSYETPILNFKGGVPLPQVTSPIYDFIGIYSQAQDVSVKSWRVTLYSQNKEDIVEQTKWEYSSYIHHRFKGLIHNKIYYIQYEVVNKKGMTAISEKQLLNVSYSSYSLRNTLTAKNFEDKGYIGLSWSRFHYINGVGSGTYGYLPGYPTRRAFAPTAPGATFAVKVPSIFTIAKCCRPLDYANFNKPILHLSHSSNDNKIEVKYDATQGLFVLEVMGQVIDSRADFVAQDESRVIVVSHGQNGYEWMVKKP